MNAFFEDIDNMDSTFPQDKAECQSCDIFLPVNDLGLCEDCAGKLDRDMIRKRDWAYSVLAFEY
jgi:predicted amidophosphoribosyltransferase